MAELIFIFGTRPEAIKMAPLVLRARESGKKTRVVFSGQHRDMALPIFELFGLSIDHNLEMMAENSSLNQAGGRLMARLDSLLAEAAPGSTVIVQGDTLTASVGALAAFYRRMPIAHIEAGLRTGDTESPWPEEFNRRMIALAARWHFCPTLQSSENLLREGIPAGRIHVVGNTGIDALMLASRTIPAVTNSRKVLVTMHRRESFGEPLRRVFELLKRQSRFEDREFVLPLHPNPAVRNLAAEVFGFSAEAPLPRRIGLSLRLTEPLEYASFVREMSECRFVITDSGGIQEEAPCLGKPVLIAREKTERMELVDCGSGELVGCETNLIEERIEELLRNSPRFQAMAAPRFPFGDGRSAARILNVLRPSLQREEARAEFA